MSDSAGQPTLAPRALWPRLARFLPYFRGARWALPGMIAATVTAAVTEPAIPALMKPLLDRGFQAGSLSLWVVPAALLGLFAVRGVAGFVAQYSLAFMANHAMVTLRGSLFNRLLDAPMTMFGRTSASTLSNTVVTRCRPAPRCWSTPCCR